MFQHRLGVPLADEAVRDHSLGQVLSSDHPAVPAASPDGIMMIRSVIFRMAMCEDELRISGLVGDHGKLLLLQDFGEVIFPDATLSPADVVFPEDSKGIQLYVFSKNFFAHPFPVWLKLNFEINVPIF